jgi:hypothetical protein
VRRCEQSSVGDALEAAIEQFATAEPPVQRDQIPAWVARLPFEEIQLADEACERFAFDLCWPRLSPAVAAQIRVRLEGALALFRAGGLSMMKNMPAAEAVATLLVTFWHRKGIEWTQAIYRSAEQPPGN